MRFHCLKATELKRGSLLFTTKLSEIPDTQFGRPRKNKTESSLEPPSGFEHGTSEMGIQRLNH